MIKNFPDTVVELKRGKVYPVQKNVTGILTLDGWDAFVKKLKEECEKVGADFKELDDKIMVDRTAQLKPKMYAESYGLLTVRGSGDYTFEDERTGEKSYGQTIKKENIVGGKLVFPMFGGGEITYSLLTK